LYVVRLRSQSPDPASVALVFKDDTGASSPVISPDDLALLGIAADDDYDGWVESRTFRTAKGPVDLPRIILEGALSADQTSQAPITEYKQFTCGVLRDCPRIGGPMLRSLALQGTLPDGRNRLAVAMTRTSLGNMLRDHANT